jgi:SH3 domain protein
VKNILILICFLIPSTAFSKTAYVSDELDIMVRSGQSGSHRIISTLKSGAKVNVLSFDEASGYSRVSFNDGREGWVLARLLQKSPAAKARLATAKSTFNQQTAELKELQAKVKLLGNTKGELDSQSVKLLSDNTALNEQLDRVKAASSNAIQTLEERDQLQMRVVKLERELETLKRQNNVLSNTESQTWFLIGSGVLLFGLFLGFFLPKLSWRKSSSWNSSF